MEREEALQEADLRAVTKKLAGEHVCSINGLLFVVLETATDHHCQSFFSIQEKEMKAFRDTLKQEQKLLKQECEAVAKSERKELYRMRKEKLDQEQLARVSAVQSFTSQLSDQFFPYRIKMTKSQS